MMEIENRNRVPINDDDMLIRLTNLLESSCLQKMSASSPLSSPSSSSVKYAVGNSPERNSCGRSTSSSSILNAADMLDYGGYRDQQKKSKGRSIAISGSNGDGDHFPTKSAISFKSWQSKVGASTTVASNGKKGNCLKGVVCSTQGSRSRIADGFQQVAKI